VHCVTRPAARPRLDGGRDGSVTARGPTRSRLSAAVAKRLRDSAHRHEELGLSEEEATFYDALAGGVEHVKAGPNLAALAHELAESIRKDLSVDWIDREATEAKIRTKIKRLLRRNRDKLPKCGCASGTDPSAP
jgi:hypothetical protein